MIVFGGGGEHHDRFNSMFVLSTVRLTSISRDGTSFPFYGLMTRQETTEKDL